MEPITREKRDALMLSVREYFQDAKGEGTWHFPVAHLNVAAEWAVAGVTFRPRGWLARHVAEPASPPPGDLAEAAARLDCATVDVHAESLEAARTQARDAVGLLRYYQRFLKPYMATQVARFGLTDEVFVNENLYVRERDDEGYLFGVGVAGRPGPFEFGVGYVTDFNYEPGLTVLAESLAAASPTDWQRRFRTCLRFLGHAALIDEQQLRIVLLAAGLEVLLADGSMARPSQGTPKGTTADEVARRCAYVACGTSGAVGDKPGSPECAPAFCPSLTATDADARRRAIRRCQARGQRATCEVFEAGRRLFDDRNAVLHQGRDDFKRADATPYALFADQIVLSAARWVHSSGADRLKDLVRQMPRAG